MYHFDGPEGGWRGENASIPKVVTTCALLILGLLATAPAAHAQNALGFFKNYFVTGDYAVAGVGLRGSGVNGVASGTIHFDSGAVPPDADVLGAFLYWETVVTQNNPDAGVAGARFKGNDISSVARALNPAGTSPCWSSGGGTGGSEGAHRMIAYRADVLRFLTVDPGTGKLAVAGDHTVQLADAGTGNQVPSVAGASLVVIYRDPTKPLKAIVIYDGGYTMDQVTDGMALTMSGFYQASSVSPASKMTHLVADGQSNFTERVRFNGATQGSNVFNGNAGGTPDTGWDNVTFDNLPMAPDASSADILVDHVGTPFDCLSWGAVILSTTVQDSDDDGLLDRWEETSGLTDPKGQPLPDLRAMGANKNVQDIFLQIDSMATAGYTDLQGEVKAHSHLPSKDALDMVAQAYRLAGPRKSGISGPINIHFDVGGNYQPSPGDPSPTQCFVGDPKKGTAPAWQASCAYIPVALTTARMEIPEEQQCAVGEACAFPGFHGVVGWKRGYKYIRDQLFPRNRKDMFRYALWAHALGLAYDADNPNTPYDDTKAPRRTSGIADPPGGDLMITLGWWDDSKGKPFMQASTLLHELGHTATLKHGGRDDNGDLALNCRPNYQSSMNYLFQTRGLVCDASSKAPMCLGRLPGDIVIDYSGQKLKSLGEDSLPEALGLTDVDGTAMYYRTRWYAPYAGNLLASKLPGLPVAASHCDGSANATGAQMLRVEGTSLGPTIDWDGDGVLDGTAVGPQDMTFNGEIANLGTGYNDWLALDLRHVGSRRNVGGDLVNGALSLDVTDGDLGKGDLGKGDLGKGDLGKGDLGKGDLGKGDLGKGDLGKGDLGAPPGDLDFQTALALGNDPNALSGTVAQKSIALTWKAPNVGKIVGYDVWRAIGSGIDQTNISTLVTVATSTTTSAVDTSVKNNTTYTYFVVARFNDGTTSGPSNFYTVLKK